MENKCLILRGGAPDKFNYNGVGSNIKYDKLDNTNLRDLSTSEIQQLIQDQYILPGDEGDIIKADSFNSDKIILPNIDPDLIHKNSTLYESLVGDLTYWKYPKFNTLNCFEELNKSVIKCTLGSGSREVYVENPELADKVGYPFVHYLGEDKYEDLCTKANKTSYVMQQDIIPNLYSLKKATANLVFRDSKLLGYVWTEVSEKNSLTTNWNRGEHVVSDFTDKAIEEVSNFLLKYITRGIVNIDFHINYDSGFSWVTEFNWRIGNNFFEATAASIDIIEQYIFNTKFRLPQGRNEFIRYWNCGYTSNNPRYSKR